MWEVVGGDKQASGVTIILTTHYSKRPQERARPHRRYQQRVRFAAWSEARRSSDAEARQEAAGRCICRARSNPSRGRSRPSASNFAKTGNELILRIRHKGRAPGIHELCERPGASPAIRFSDLDTTPIVPGIFVSRLRDAMNTSAIQRTSICSRWPATGAR